jgi:hypothetical protein
MLPPKPKKGEDLVKRQRQKSEATKRWETKNPGYSAAKSKEWRKAHPSYYSKARKAAWEAAHPGYGNRKAKESNLRKQERLAGRKKPTECEACGNDVRLCFDHCHKCKKFRNWLCHNCNVILGHAKDNPELLRKLARRLVAHHKICGGPAML